MKKLLLSLFTILAVTGTYAQIKSPADLYPRLYEAVEMSRIYPDSKSFPDATPLHPPIQIMQIYRKESIKPGFKLEAFIKQNFATPTPSGSVYHTDIHAGIRKHIDTLWTILQHMADTVKGTSLLALPHPYIVPGGRFREIYYWDTYFTMLGLKENRRYQLIQHMCDNFAYLIDHYGHIPNGNRSYYLSRSQPPYFALMIELLASIKGKHILVQYRPELIKEYTYWMHGASSLSPGMASEHVVKLKDGTLLNRYWDAKAQPREESYREDVLTAQHSIQGKANLYRNLRAAAESGWDFSSRWLANGKTLGSIQTTNLIPVDLNCLLYHLESLIAESYQVSKSTSQANTYASKATKRKQAILRYCWNNTTNCFTDYNWQQRRLSTQVTLATMYPLFLKLATPAQASSIASLIKSRFLKPGGVTTTLVPTGQQWDEPNGWAPLQYVTVAGLNNYKQLELAKTIALRWVHTNIDHFNQNGKLVEKYDIENTQVKAGGGEYPTQDGFGWTNGVLLKLMNMYDVKD